MKIINVGHRMMFRYGLSIGLLGTWGTENLSNMKIED